MQFIHYVLCFILLGRNTHNANLAITYRHKLGRREKIRILMYLIFKTKNYLNKNIMILLSAITITLLINNSDFVFKSISDAYVIVKLTISIFAHSIFFIESGKFHILFKK